VTTAPRSSSPPASDLLPPLSPELAGALAAMRPVSPRVPLRAVLVVTLGSAAWAWAVLQLLPVRADLPWLPRLPWLLVGGLWLLGYAVALGAALLPRRAQVLPDPARALRVALLLCSSAALLLVALPLGAPGHTHIPASAAEEWRHGVLCFVIAVAVAAVPCLLGLLALRRLAPTGARSLGAAVGGAAGSLGGLGLHIICDVGGRCHLAFAHGGAVVACSLVGALIGGLAFGGGRESGPTH